MLQNPKLRKCPYRQKDLIRYTNPITTRPTAKRLSPSTPSGHKETQPFAPGIQRSSDAPSPTGKPLNLPLQINLPPYHPTVLNLTARAGDAVWSASAGGELILRRWKSALLQNFSLSERRQTRVREILKRF